MRDDLNLIGLGIVIGLSLAFIFFMIYNPIDNNDYVWEVKLVQQGYADWIINDYGKVEFKLKSITQTYDNGAWTAGGNTTSGVKYDACKP